MNLDYKIALASYSLLESDGAGTKRQKKKKVIIDTLPIKYKFNLIPVSYLLGHIFALCSLPFCPSPMKTLCLTIREVSSRRKSGPRP